MTCRNTAQGEAAKQHVEQKAGITGQGKIQIRELDMSRYASCVSFVSELKQSEEGLDCAVLNAGVINARFVESPEGWLVWFLLLLYYDKFNG